MRYSSLLLKQIQETWANALGGFTAYILTRFRSWEPATQIGFVFAIILFVLAVLLFLYSPVNMRQPALVGAIGLMFALQIIFMWGNRNMVTPFTLAQRNYLREDFSNARTILEAVLSEGKADVNTMTLLANTYRQLGLLDKSEEIVKKALGLRPFDHFPLYSFGRTLLITGRYEQAVDAFRQALDNGAPIVAQFDLGEALYRQNQIGMACEVLRPLLNSEQESFRKLMTCFILWCGKVVDFSDPKLITDGLLYWENQVARFGQTPYGESVKADVDKMRSILEEL